MIARETELSPIRQSEFLEQVARLDTIAKIAMIPDDFEGSAARLRELSDETYTDLIETSIDLAADSEPLTDEPRAYQF